MDHTKSEAKVLFNISPVSILEISDDWNATEERIDKYFHCHCLTSFASSIHTFRLKFSIHIFRLKFSIHTFRLKSSIHTQCVPSLLRCSLYAYFVASVY